MEQHKGGYANAPPLPNLAAHIFEVVMDIPISDQAVEIIEDLVACMELAGICLAFERDTIDRAKYYIRMKELNCVGRSSRRSPG